MRIADASINGSMRNKFRGSSMLGELAMGRLFVSTHQRHVNFRTFLTIRKSSFLHRDYPG